MHFHEFIHSLTERPAEVTDEAWLWEQYKELLKPVIKKQWGWNEEFQHTNFHRHLPYSEFKVIETGNRRIGAYSVRYNRKIIRLQMILVTTDNQKRGVGSHILKQLKVQANKDKIPIELSIFPANTVSGFYEKSGFSISDKTTEKITFLYYP